MGVSAMKRLFYSCVAVLGLLAGSATVKADWEVLVSSKGLVTVYIDPTSDFPGPVPDSGDWLYIYLWDGWYAFRVL
jgi:hypothetical protein